MRRLLPVVLLFTLLLPMVHAADPVKADEPHEVRDDYLGRNLRLTFELQPMGNGDRPWAVHTATKGFSLNVAFTQTAAQFSIEIEGTVEDVRVDGKPRLLIEVDTALEYSGDGTNMTISAHGSRAVILGQKTTLATLGDKTLVVLVEEVD